MNKLVLKAENREIVGSKVRKMRREGFVPATVFGKTITSSSLKVSAVEFNKVYKLAGETSLIWLQVDSETKERPTLVKSVSTDPIKGKIIHIDFHQVNLKEKVTANVPVEIIGESQLVKDGLAVLDTHLQELEVEALPTDIPEKIVFDISTLKEIGDNFSASSAVLPSGVTLMSDPDTIVVALGEPQKEEEPLDTTVAETKVPGEEDKESAEGDSSSEEKPKE